MPSVEISEQAYTQALQAAEARGVSLQTYLESLITHAVEVEEDFESLIAAERYAYVDRASGQVEIGEYLTADQVTAELEANQQAWRQGMKL